MDFTEFPKILSLLRRENPLFEMLASGSYPRTPLAIPPSTFDLVTSVFRETGMGVAGMGGVKSAEGGAPGNADKQQQQQKQQQKQVEPGASTAEQESDSHTPVPSTGLRLAQYTLENIPENPEIQSRFSARLLELLTSAKGTLSARLAVQREEILVDLSGGSDQPSLESATPESDLTRSPWADFFHEGIRRLMNLQLHFYLRGMFSSQEMPVVKNAPVECMDLFFPWFLQGLEFMNKEDPLLSLPHIFSDRQMMRSVFEKLSDQPQEVFEIFLGIVMNGLRKLLIDSSKVPPPLLPWQPINNPRKNHQHSPMLLPQSPRQRINNLMHRQQ
jgi:hypothetical protein